MALSLLPNSSNGSFGVSPPLEPLPQKYPNWSLKPVGLLVLNSNCSILSQVC